MAGISTLGVGSGLGLSTILDKLTAAEKQSLTPISKQQSAATAKLSAYGTLKTAIQAFQTANTKLKDASLYTATSTTSSSSAFSADTNGSALAGKYTISVDHLAQSQTLTSLPKADVKAAMGDGSDSRILKFVTADGKEKSITLTKDQTSLSALRDTINKSNVGISASLIKVSSTEFRLSLTSSATGTDHAVKSLSVTGDDTLHGFIGFDAADTANSGMTQSVEAQNASLTVNNVPIESSSNTISDAVEGITLKLNDKTSGNQTLSVSTDTSKAKNAITDWVNSYNSLQDTIGNLTKYTAVDAGKDQDSKNGALLGDGTLRNIQTQLKSILANSSGSTVYKTLSQAGITTDPTDGKLKLDADKLTTALQVKPDAIRDMFSGDGKKTGVTTVLDTTFTAYLSSKGILQGATDSISKKLNQLTEQYNTTSKRIDDKIARYKTQFTNLDKMVSVLNNTSTYLTQQFESTNSSKK
ncbi:MULTISPECIES: flagellar filament capping protein FliD [unclassified Pantoea]|uniref:flagellar filament capping protein FliD n=1 Tax=unclassified Pantoea TaxID=2630326 RepID=UPI001CD27E3F|nr:MULTISPECIES: flagellar filament capping protein FliD [unclassified Pantoea]MCA1177621.1 flagellar filament capping protein FliD [Pantoea sp. alder69]MCA1249473.1 flagellar filament capping protein FliD [Pantoea sp. alder70]MCA1266110.1 flagellar filament capping protein FliD [Pantoea sp. alder81]